MSRRRWVFIALGVVVLIPVLLVAGFSLLLYLNYKPSNIVDFHPTRFDAVASRPFFYSVGKELKYGSQIDERAPTLLRGDISESEISPDGEKIAVVADGVLKVVDRSGGTVATIARVQSIFKEQKPYGVWFFREGNIQWSPDSQDVYLIRDKYYHSKGAQLYSKYGQLWRYDLKAHTLHLVLKPFPAGSYFFGRKGGIYFSVPTPKGDLYLEYFDGKTVRKIEAPNGYYIPFHVLQSKFKERPFYSFLYQENFELNARHVHISHGSKQKPEGLYVGQRRYLRFTVGNGFKGRWQCLDMNNMKFLPGGRYLQINTYCSNYEGQLLLDTQNGAYMRLPKDTRVYLKMNTVTDPLYRITVGGILPN